MKEYKVALFGHRDFCASKEIEERLYFILRDLIRTKEFVKIYIGRNGEFDVFAASIIRRVKDAFGGDNSEMTLVLPYCVKDVEYYEQYYDCISIPIEKTHYKGAIEKRNKWMVEKCNLLICYVNRTSGGAYAALQYANKLGKRVINLAAGKSESSKMY